jgi:hypothetical protein
MSRPTRRRSSLRPALLALLAAVLGAASLPGPAAAAAPEDGWTCRAQSLTVGIGGASPLQPLTNLLAAGGEFEPCQPHDNSPVASTLEPLTNALAALGVSVGVATTDTTADVSRPTRDQTPTAHAEVADVDVALAGVPIVHVEATEATVQGSCASGTPAFTSSSDVGGVTIFGQPVDLDTAVVELSRGIAGLDVLVRLTPASVTDDPTYGYTRRALRVEVLTRTFGIEASVLDLGVGVANVTAKGTPCAAALPPTVAVPTVDGRTITSAVTPPAGTSISSCSFAVTPAGGTAAVVPGVFDATTGECTAVLAPSAYPAGGYTATATATTAEGGAATSAPSAPFTLAAPSAGAPTVAAPTIDGRTVSAAATPATGATIASCGFVLTPSGGSAVAVTGAFADGRCTAALPRAGFAPGTFAILATATDDAGEVGDATGTGTIAGPTVGAPLAVGPLVGAAVTPGSGATVASCTITATPVAGGVPRTVPGTYDAGTGACGAILPAGTFPDGEYNVTVTVTDSNGDSAASTGRVRVSQIAFGAVTPPAASGGGAPTARPATATDVGQALLFCEKRRLTLLDVAQTSTRVRLSGVAETALAGRTVTLRFAAKGRRTATVGRAKVAADGTFSASVPRPAARHRTTKASPRYTAVVGSASSSALKLVRRMVVTSVSRGSGTIRMTGRISAPLPRSRQLVTISRRTSCTKYQTVARVRATKTGRFTARFPAPSDGSAGLYRASTKVPSRVGGPASNGTYTLPRIVVPLK